ncbi:large ribosomal subunit protein uL18m [Anopheles ziemanni]|uniref:large ribosomal subunit protein uL18m n=1 Tax=Anopheles coustani TaxID=139045 RepID=UPI00265A50B5|nr:large ribosomal subunit protein uL18m [Anopheles coustani]XP_058176784.1 large ribosomal subunit protein uL18m [Anopheles ziemanni]
MAASAKRILSKIRQTNQASNGELCMVNRNPRNLERLRLAYKTDGYHLEKPVRNFWHRLEITATNKYVTAKVVHFQNGPVIECSTTEWALKRHLYKGNDFSAYTNLAKVFAARCLDAGLTEMWSDLKPSAGGKVESFLRTVEECGVKLQEPERIRPSYSWDMHRPEKPWEITE